MKRGCECFMPCVKDDWIDGSDLVTLSGVGVIDSLGVYPLFYLR